MGDDIQTALAKRRPWSQLPSRTGTDFGSLNVAELTSRVAGADITATLDQMAVPFDPRFDSAAGKRELRALREAGKPVPTREVSPFDVILATSMLQVGVDEFGVLVDNRNLTEAVEREMLQAEDLLFEHVPVGQQPVNLGKRYSGIGSGPWRALRPPGPSRALPAEAITLPLERVSAGAREAGCGSR
jgi:hypothetical protein